MRVHSETTTLAAAPGDDVHVDVVVTNTGDVIDGVTVVVHGIDAAHVTSTPAVLPLFPGESGRVALRVAVPASFPAGRHVLDAEVRSSAPNARAEHLDVELAVAARPRLALTVHPPVQRRRGHSRHRVECHNGGNVPLSVVLGANDPDSAVQAAVDRPALTVAPGRTATAMLTIRAARRLLGNDVDRPVNVHATATATGYAGGGLVSGRGPAVVEEDAPAVLRHRPVVARGVLTAGVLLLIVGLWAAAFLVGLETVFARDRLTKTAPPSFFLAAAGEAAPRDARARIAAVPAGLRGEIAGTVRARRSRAPVGRVVVTARLRHGAGFAATAATQADGSYVVTALPLGTYCVDFAAPGFAPKAASCVAVAPQQATRLDAEVDGRAATVSGSVDTGGPAPFPVTTVEVRAAAGGAPVATVRTDRRGRYRLTGLPAPARYLLRFRAPGYRPATLAVTAEAGGRHTEPAVRLSAGEGTIAGTVVDATAGTPLGGVTVSTSRTGEVLATETPTLGRPGRFALRGLATPGTYLVTFTKPGYGAGTLVVRLGPGGSATRTVRLRSGAGAVTGMVTDAAGAPLGGVTVTAGGSAVPARTTTLTDGDGKGGYALAGLPVPGSYTVTFRLPGYADRTVPVVLDRATPSATVSAVLAPDVGGIDGTVEECSGKAVAGATVSVTDGRTARTAVSAADGTFGVGGLRPATYTVTVSREGRGSRTTLVEVRAGRRTPVTVGWGSRCG